MKSWKNPLPTLTLTPPQPALFNGFVKVESAPELDIQPDAPTGLLPVEAKYLPEALRGETKPDEPEPLAFQFHGSAYSLPLKITLADPETRQVVLRDFKLTGQLAEQSAAFTLTATARVKKPARRLAHAAFRQRRADRTRAASGLARLPMAGRFVLVFDKAGRLSPHRLKVQRRGPAERWLERRRFPRRAERAATDRPARAGRGHAVSVRRRGAAGAHGQRLRELSAAGRRGETFVENRRAGSRGQTFLRRRNALADQRQPGPDAAGRAARLQSHARRAEPRDAAACAARAKSRASRATRCSRGTSSRARTPPTAASSSSSTSRRKNQFALQVQMQTPLGAFPQTADAMQLRPEGATRFAGYFRIVNEGAVRLEVAQAKRPLADFARAISRERRHQGGLPRRAASGLPTVFPARTSRCASRPIKSCRS